MKTIKNFWTCPNCNYNAIWDNYEDGTPICPDCDIDMDIIKLDCCSGKTSKYKYRDR